MRILSILLFKFSLFLIKRSFRPKAGSTKNSKKYKKLISITNTVSRFMVDLDRKWETIVHSDAEFSDHHELVTKDLLLDRLSFKPGDTNIKMIPAEEQSDSVEISKEKEETTEIKLAKESVSEEAIEGLSEEIKEDLDEITEEIKTDAFYL